MESKIILDMSRYQAGVKFDVLRQAGQTYAFAKCGSGNGIGDIMWKSHYTNGTANGIKIAPYFWVDPIYNPITQAKFFLNSLNGYDVPFIAIDWEQWWVDWVKWTAMMRGQLAQSAVPTTTTTKQFLHFKQVYEYMAANTDRDIIVYTAKWFLDGYCPQGFNYLKDKWTWWADYRGYAGTAVQKTWKQLEDLAPTDGNIPSLPITYPRDKILLRQFSGDRYMANGVYGNATMTRLSVLDLNVWVNKYVTIEQLDKSGSIVVPPIPPVYTQTYEVTAYRLNIRAAPTVNSAIIGGLSKGDRVEVESEIQGWGKLYGRPGYISLYYAKRI